MVFIKNVIGKTSREYFETIKRTRNTMKDKYVLFFKEKEITKC